MVKMNLMGCVAILAQSTILVSAFTAKRHLDTTTAGTRLSTRLGIRVAYQGEPGAYSEKSTRELLGGKVTAIGRPDFESCFRAVASMEVDYACLPVENSLGGSIHENYDLMLRYDLTICAEHEFRVQHCILVKPGVKLEDIKYAISHPQALAQCDNYLRGLDIKPVPTYDTAGSAKMIIDHPERMPDNCTPENTCAIASDMAGTTYGLDCLAASVEDDDTNFTRFLLLGRKGVLPYLTKQVPSKTSVVFTLSNTAGALYKALACFSLRDIDMAKIESRPTSASLLNYLKFRSQQNGDSQVEAASLPRFRYCFYLDFLSSQLDVNTENALAHLKEHADFVRILGSYPQKSRLVGPIKDEVEELENKVIDPKDTRLMKLPSDGDMVPLNIGIVGFGSFGQFLAERMKLHHRVSCLDDVDRSSEARNLGIDFFPHYENASFLQDLDVVILAVQLIDLEEVVSSLPMEKFGGKLVVDVTPVNSYPRGVLLKTFADQPDVDILVTNPMLGPKPQLGSNENMSSNMWDGRPMAYDRVRISNVQRCERYLQIFQDARCQVLEIDSKQHDESIAQAEFVTHMIGRLLNNGLLPPTPLMSKEYEDLCNVAEMTAGDTLDLFYGMYKHNEKAKEYLTMMRENIADIERKLAARNAYLVAKAEIMQSDRQKLLSETRMLLQELAKTETVPIVSAAPDYPTSNGSQIEPSEASESPDRTATTSANDDHQTSNGSEK